MKKAINKTERASIISALVVQAAGVTAQTIFDNLVAIRKQIEEALLSNWEDQFPGISKQDRLALLASGGASSLNFKPSIYTAGEKEGPSKNSGEFGSITWRNSGNDYQKQRVALLASAIFQNAAGVTGQVTDGVTSGYNSQLYLYRNFPALIAGSQPTGLYDASLEVPKETDPVFNGLILALHVKAAHQLNQLKDLIYATDDAYVTLEAALAPIKTAQQLAELMPEAVKFFPPSMTYVKPTKEIADPKAINEIRAKLKKGLPI